MLFRWLLETKQEKGFSSRPQSSQLLADNNSNLLQFGPELNGSMLKVFLSSWIFIDKKSFLLRNTS